MAPRILHTVDAVIDAVGGTSAAAALTERTPQHVSNWRSEGRIAGWTYLIFKDALERERLVAPSQLWGIFDPATQPKKRRAKAAAL